MPIFIPQISGINAYLNQLKKQNKTNNYYSCFDDEPQLETYHKWK